MRVAVDGIIYHEKKQAILVIKRKYPPFKDTWAIPGGMVNDGETVENALIREMKEETSLDVEPEAILGVYSDPKRDPRGHVISIVFITRWNENQEPQANDDAKEHSWLPLEYISKDKLAFDHHQILKDFKSWLKKNYSTFWSSKQR